jgi:integrase
MGERTGIFLKLKRRKSGLVWIARVMRTRPEDGKKLETTRVIGTKREFPNEAAVWREIERRQLDAVDGVMPAENLTFSALAQSYIRQAIPKLAHSTGKLNSHIIRDYLLPRWGTKSARNIRPLEIQNWLDSLVDKGLANATRYKIKSVFGAVFSYGRLYSLVPPDCTPTAPVTCSSEGEEAIFVPPNLAFRLAVGLPLLIRILLIVTALTGLRISEVLGLQWQDLDFTGQRILVKRAWVQGRLKVPKTKSSAKPVPLGPVLGEFLKEWQKNSTYTGATDFVFPSMKLKGTKPPSGSQMVKDYLRPKAIELGIISKSEKRRFGFHSMRHGLATFLVGQRVDPKTVQSILRHARVGLTLDAYSHAMPQSTLDAQNLAAEAMIKGAETVQ